MNACVAQSVYRFADNPKAPGSNPRQVDFFFFGIFHFPLLCLKCIRLLNKRENKKDRKKISTCRGLEPGTTPTNYGQNVLPTELRDTLTNNRSKLV